MKIYIITLSLLCCFAILPEEAVLEKSKKETHHEYCTRKKNTCGLSGFLAYQLHIKYDACEDYCEKCKDDVDWDINCNTHGGNGIG